MAAKLAPDTVKLCAVDAVPGQLEKALKVPLVLTVGGLQVYFVPEVGLTVLDNVTDELFNVPAEVDPQFVVDNLLLKSVLADPLNPISNVVAVVLVGPFIS